MHLFNKYKELIVTAGLVLALAIIWNLNGFYDNNMMLASVITIFIILFTFFAVIILKDKPRDEREERHLYIANQSAFIAGTTVLTVAIVVQALDHMVDVWIIIALIVMLLTKVIVRKRYQDCC